MSYVRWVFINGLFAAFFLFSGMIPLPIFNGLYFVLWLFLLFSFGVLALSVFMFTVFDHDTEFIVEAKTKVKKKRPKISTFYVYLDFTYDVFMTAVIAGLGYYVFATFYALTHILLHIYRKQIYG
jgi:hypothetical protein